MLTIPTTSSPSLVDAARCSGQRPHTSDRAGLARSPSSSLALTLDQNVRFCRGERGSRPCPASTPSRRRPSAKASGVTGLL